MPSIIQKKIDYKRRKKWYKLSRIVEDYYRGKTCSPEEKTCLEFLHKNHFNLNSTRLLYLSKVTDYYQSKYSTIPVHISKTDGLPYICHQGKPLYFPRGTEDNSIRKCYAQFLSEMDQDSPHLYCKDPEQLCNRVLFDCGVAEGLFPLTYIDYFKKIVLFECNPDWIEALQATFAPYNDKVSIVQSYVSDVVSEDSITLDYYSSTNNIQPDFIKMDIEGYEERALTGASTILEEKNDLICSICTYHTPDAETNIVKHMQQKGYNPSYNKGFMFFFYEDVITPPYLRHGVIRFSKKGVQI